MGSSGKRKTTFAKLARESRLRERRLEKQAKRDARKQRAAEHPPTAIGDTPTAIGDTPTEIGDTPTEIGDTPAQIGDTPTEVGEKPAGEER